MKDRYNPHEIDEKWQRKWSDAKIFEPEPDSREKFFITIPYPYLNGNLHAGHTRTFTIGDVIARYKRMLGYNVLFPMGFHATGTPIVGLAEQIEKKDPKLYAYIISSTRSPLKSLILYRLQNKLLNTSAKKTKLP